MQNSEHFNKTNIYLFGIFILYVILNFYIGSFHEPWSDEAQSWLLARDCSVRDLIVNALKYEGHPILWYLILKIAQFFHLAFDNINLLSFSLSAIGVFLLLFKTKVPIFFKTIIPFCYYIFYQYAIIARSHSLVFPLLMLISIFYPKKENKIIEYSILLILLANVSFYGYFISFVLFADFVLSLFKKENIKRCIPLYAVGLNFILTYMYLRKPYDCSFPAGQFDIRSLFETSLNVIPNIFFNISLTENHSYAKGILLTLFILILIYKIINTVCKHREQKILLYVLNFSFLAVLSVFYVNEWHYGYEFLIIVFSLALMCNANDIQKIDFKTNKLFYVCFAIVLFVQSAWSIKSSILEKYFVFSPGKEIAEFIKKNHLEDSKIVGMDFNITSVNPYFEKNIFSNTPKAYWYWRRNVLKRIIYSEEPIILLEIKNNRKRLYKRLENKYNFKVFNGALISKGRFKEDLSLVLCIPKSRVINDE